MDPVHRRLAEVGLQAAERFGFALAGGYAVQEHGFIQRQSEDVDLFTAWERRGAFDEAVEAVVAAYRDAGYLVEIPQRFETFARLSVVDPDQPGRAFKVELAASWRAKLPVTLEIGPVIHPDDAVAGKLSALYSRAEPRDFLDVDAALASGRYSRERLCELALEADAGFDRKILAEVFGVMERYPDRRFAVYGPTSAEIAGLRARFLEWRQTLLGE